MRKRIKWPFSQRNTGYRPFMLQFLQHKKLDIITKRL